MADEAVEDVVGVLPDGLSDHERGVGRDVAEDLHPIFLAIDEAVLLFWIVGMGALDLPSFAFNGLGDLLFHGGLGFLAFLIGRGAEIAACDEIDDFHWGMEWEYLKENAEWNCEASQVSGG